MVGSLAMMLSSSYCEMLLGLVRGIVVMNLIGPTGRGIMRLVALFLKYLTHTHLGMLHGISKGLPQALGRGDAATADDVESVGASVVTLTSLLSGLGLFVFGWLSGYGTETRLALMAGGGLLVTQQSYALYRCVVRAWGRFSVLASAQVVNTVTQFVLIISGAALFGVTGAMLGWLFATALAVLYFRFAIRFSVPIRLDRRVALRLLATGVPIGLILLTDTLLRTADAIVVARMFGLYVYGLYSVPMQTATYLYGIPGAVGFVIMPRILETHAAGNDADELRRQVLLPTIAAATYMPLAAGCAFILLPPLVRAVIPKFEGCIFAAQVLALASVLLALPIAANQLLIAVNKEFFVVRNNLLGSLVIFILGWWRATHLGSLSSIAYAAGVGYLVSGLLSLIEVLGRYYKSKVELVAQVALCYAPLAWCVAALPLSGRLARSVGDGSGSDWWETLTRLGIFLVAMLPVLVYGNARTGMVREFSRVARKAYQRLRKRGGS